jgi:hypothetical protein
VELIDRSRPEYLTALLQNLEFAYAKVTDEFAVGTIAGAGQQTGVNANTADRIPWVTHPKLPVLFMDHHLDSLATLLFHPDNGQTSWDTTTTARRYTMRLNRAMRRDLCAETVCAV